MIKTITIKNNRTLHNTIMLYMLTLAKIIFPLITLPYLTHVLSVSSYGCVAFVKSYVVYMQLIVDFGFLLSSVKDIVEAGNDYVKIGIITGQTILARIILSMTCFIITLISILVIPIMRENIIYTLLSVFVVMLSSFLVDFLFRGIEKMHVITIAFVVMKTIATALTLVLVKSSSDILWIPTLDILGIIFAILFTWIEIRKYKIPIKIQNITQSFKMIKKSFIYFSSEIATTAFGALNTFLIGISMDNVHVAYWSVALQLIAAVNSLYIPIVNGMFPQMVRDKSFARIKKILYIFMPIVTVGCVILFFIARQVIIIISGEKYIGAVEILQALIPVLFISFPGMILGWPALGAINKAKETTKTTIITAVVQVIGLIVLKETNSFTLINIAILRCATEFLMFYLRARYCYIFIGEFAR